MRDMPYNITHSVFLRSSHMLPGPLAEERGVPRGTIIGDTNTASDPSLLSDAVPSSLMVLRRILAYSKSTAATCIGEGVDM
jgi:hypothetical protein